MTNYDYLLKSSFFNESVIVYDYKTITKIL